MGTVCPTFLQGAINDRPGVRVTWPPPRGVRAMHHQPATPGPPPSFEPPPPRAPLRFGQPLDTPQHHRNRHPAHLLLPLPFLPILSPLATTVVATTTAAATTVGGCSWCCTNTRGRGWSSRRIYVHVVSLQSFLFLEGGVLNGVVATLLLATEQVSPRL